jgi:hypothetical protein
MKRFVLILTILLAVSSAVNAQTGFTNGIRLGPGFAFNEAEKDLKYNNATEESNIVFVMAFYGAYAVFPKFSVQAELDVMINNGMTISVSGPAGKITSSFASIDIPVLAKYNLFESSTFIFGVLGGPYISFGMGKFEGETSGSLKKPGASGKYANDIEGVRFGVTAGAAAGFKVGPGNIVVDARFLTDFSPVKIKDVRTFEMLTRRGINLTVGYETRF